MEEIERLQRELLDIQRQMVTLTDEYSEVMKMYTDFDYLQETLEIFKQKSMALPEDLIAKMDEVIAAVERRKN